MDIDLVAIAYISRSTISLNCLVIPKKVQVGNDQEKPQSERESLSENRGGKN